METKANYLLIGAFTIAGFFGLLAFLMWLMGHDNQGDFDDYFVLFPEIGGISAGTQVQFSGVPVGQVTDIRLAPNGSVRVQMRLREDTPIRTDSEAVMMPQGITGLSLVSVSSGSASAELLEPAADGAMPQIRAGRSVLDSLTESAPALLDELRHSAEQLGHLLSDDNISRANAVLANVESASANLDQAISDVSAAVEGVAEVATTLGEFSKQFDGLGAQLQTTLGSADEAARQIAHAAEGVGQIDFAGISGEAQGILADLRVMLGSDDAAELPRNLSDTLAAATGLMNDLREGGAVEKLNETLEQASRAANRVAEAADGLPQLSTRVQQLAARAEGVIASFGANAALQSDARGALRELGRAAAAVASTARSIERNPSALIRGR
ncbi:MAG: MlaD family protein [Paracoccus sp. (in: a-proteobacteria)]|nr:MlaD family protein [Paracoccus sp. (in: a-proteobacteria)]